MLDQLTVPAYRCGDDPFEALSLDGLFPFASSCYAIVRKQTRARHDNCVMV